MGGRYEYTLLPEEPATGTGTRALEETRDAGVYNSDASQWRDAPAALRRRFGYAAGGALDNCEAEAIRDAARRVLAGATLSAIVEDWNRRGLRTVRGGPWRINSLSGLLLQERLTTPPAILDVETRRQLMALHESRRKGPRRATRRYLLTGILRCGLCGAGLRGMSRSPNPDLYVCPGPPHGGCSGTAVTADRADGAVRDLVIEWVQGSGGITAPDPSQLRALAEELAEYRRKLEEVSALWAEGAVTRREWLAARGTIAGHAEATEKRLERLHYQADLSDLAGEATNLERLWLSYSDSDRRKVITTVLDHVVVLPASRPRTAFQPERLQPVWR